MYSIQKFIKIMKKDENIGEIDNNTKNFIKKCIDYLNNPLPSKYIYIEKSSKKLYKNTKNSQLKRILSKVFIIKFKVIKSVIKIFENYNTNNNILAFFEEIYKKGKTRIQILSEIIKIVVKNKWDHQIFFHNIKKLIDLYYKYENVSKIHYNNPLVEKNKNFTFQNILNCIEYFNEKKI